MEPVTLALIAGIGWISVLARNYYTQMATLAIERVKLDQANSEDRRKIDRQNEQERLEREREQFDIIFQNLLTRVNEERDLIQALLKQVHEQIEASIDIDKQVIKEISELRSLIISSHIEKKWLGEERRLQDGSSPNQS